MYAIYPEFKIELDILHQNPVVPKVSLSLMNRTDLKLLSPCFSKKKRGLCNTVRRPSVRPSVRLPFDRPLSPPRLLKLES